MATQTIRAMLGYLPQAISGGPSGSGTVHVIDANAEKVALIFEAPKTGNIRKFVFRTATVTTGDTGCLLRLETVSAGAPSGTLQGTNTSATFTIQDSDDNAAITVQLTADAAVTRGDLLAFVIARADCAGTLNAQFSTFSDDTSDFPYGMNYTPSTWAKSDAGMRVAVEYDDGSYEPLWGATPFLNTTATAFNSGTNPNRRALRFSVPVPIRLAGVRVWADVNQDFSIILYGSDGTTVLATKSVNGAANRSSSGLSSYLFGSSIALAKDTYYRVAILPGAASPNMELHEFSVPTAAAMDAVPGGQAFHLSTCNGDPANEASWTQTTTGRPFILLIVDGLDDGVVSGYTDPGKANVLVGNDYDFAGVTQVAEFDEAARNTDPGEANVKTGTSYKIQNVDKTGTYAASGGGGIIGG